MEQENIESKDGLSRHNRDYMKGWKRREDSAKLLNDEFFKRSCGLSFRTVHQSRRPKSPSEKAKHNREINYVQPQPDGEGLGLHFYLENKHNNKKAPFIFMYEHTIESKKPIGPYMKIPREDVKDHDFYLKRLSRDGYYVLIIDDRDKTNQRFSDPIPMHLVEKWHKYMSTDTNNITRLNFTIPLRKVLLRRIDQPQRDLFTESVAETFELIFKK